MKDPNESTGLPIAELIKPHLVDEKGRCIKPPSVVTASMLYMVKTSWLRWYLIVQEYHYNATQI